jgi:hypothetical protein
MHHIAFPGRDQSRPVIVEIVQIGAGGDRRFRQLSDAVVEIGFAEIAAVHRIGAIAWIGEFPSVGYDQIPAEARRVIAHPCGCMGRNGGRGRMHHHGPACRCGVGEMRQRHAVHAATHRHRQRRVPFDRLAQPGLQRGKIAHEPASCSASC